MERESSKEHSVSFLWRNKSFLLWNCLSRNLTLFNQPRQRGFWRNLRYILYSMVQDSTFVKENFFSRYAKFHWNLCENLSLWDILKFLRKGMHELKTGVYADKFATFWMFPERHYGSLVSQTTLIHPTISETHVDLCNFQKHENMWIGVKCNAELFL